MIFSKKGDAIYYLSDTGETSQLWRAQRGDEKKFWWQNSDFDLEMISDGLAVTSNFSLSPDGKRLAFVEGRGDLWVSDLDGGNRHQVLESWNSPSYAWSPDGQWLAYSVDDNDFNTDVWITAVDGSGEAYNVSRHPDWEGQPSWSPDGKLLAFSGRRHGEEVDIYYVWLQKENDELGGRDRTEAEAIEAMKKGRKGAVGKLKTAIAGKPVETTPFASFMQGLARGLAGANSPKKPKKVTLKKGEKMEIDFDGLADRVRRISIPDATEMGFVWSPNSKKLGFTSKIDGKEGFYSVEFPSKLKPTLVVPKKINAVSWLAKDERILFVEDGVPGSFAKGKGASYKFTAAQSFDREAKFRVAFLQAWRAMRDSFYDGAHNGKNWNKVREKYEDVAAGAADMMAFENVIAMMLGELNASHLGFRASGRGGSGFDTGDWQRQTAHLGVKLEQGDEQLVVVDVIADGPADRKLSQLEEGDVIVSVEGLSPKTMADLLPVLNGLPGQRLEVVVERGGKELEPMTIATISYSMARELEKREVIEDNRREVERLGDGKLGYLYVGRMMWDEFENFEREIYAVGSGKDGIVIDVRDNGGGFTADHLLTVLNPVEHSVTVPRGGGEGYPNGRRVYGTWKKPIVVLCNQNSFSNAEIFSHAIKTLKRGKLVGVPTAGGVISTGAMSVMDIGTLRTPFRGWFLLDDGEDMELNGAVPDYIIWPEPGELPAGIDRQLEKAVEVLGEEVEEYLATPRPKLRRASER